MAKIKSTEQDEKFKVFLADVKEVLSAGNFDESISPAIIVNINSALSSASEVVLKKSVQFTVSWLQSLLIFLREQHQRAPSYVAIYKMLEELIGEGLSVLKSSEEFAKDCKSLPVVLPPTTELSLNDLAASLAVHQSEERARYDSQYLAGKDPGFVRLLENIRSYLLAGHHPSKQIFISHAWATIGQLAEENWTDLFTKNLAVHLKSIGLVVHLDIAQAGQKEIEEFQELIYQSDRVLVLCSRTFLYKLCQLNQLGVANEYDKYRRAIERYDSQVTAGDRKNPKKFIIPVKLTKQSYVLPGILGRYPAVDFFHLPYLYFIRDLVKRIFKLGDSFENWFEQQIAEISYLNSPISLSSTTGLGNRAGSEVGSLAVEALATFPGKIQALTFFPGRIDETVTNLGEALFSGRNSVAEKYLAALSWTNEVKDACRKILRRELKYFELDMDAGLLYYTAWIFVFPNSYVGFQNLGCLLHAKSKSMPSESQEAEQLLQQAEQYLERAVELKFCQGTRVEHAMFLVANNRFGEALVLLNQIDDDRVLQRLNYEPWAVNAVSELMRQYISEKKAAVVINVLALKRLLKIECYLVLLNQLSDPVKIANSKKELRTLFNELQEGYYWFDQHGFSTADPFYQFVISKLRQCLPPECIVPIEFWEMMRAGTFKRIIKNKQPNQLSPCTDEMLIATVLDTGDSVLQYACIKGDLPTIRKIVELLGLHAEAEIAKPNKDGLTALHLACNHQNIGVIQLFISVLGSRASEVAALRTLRGSTALHHLGVNGQQLNENAVSLMLDVLGNKAAEIAALPNIMGLTPLHYVCRNHSIESMRLVLNVLGSDAKRVAGLISDEGWTPFHFVCRYSSFEAVKLIASVLGEDAKAIAALPSKRGWTPLHLACQSNTLEVITFVLNLLGDAAAKVLGLENDEKKIPQQLFAANSRIADRAVYLLSLVNSQQVLAFVNPANVGAAQFSPSPALPIKSSTSIDAAATSVSAPGKK